MKRVRKKNKPKSPVATHSMIRSGIAYLPFAVGVVIASALASQLVPRIGPRPLIVAGAAAVAGGMFWFSRLTEHAGYASQLLGPSLVSSLGLGLVFVPLALVALHNVAERDSGVASSLHNTAQQVGGAIGLALLGTVAWTTVANSVRTQVAQAAAGGLGQSSTAKAGQPVPKPGTPPPPSIYDHALTVGFSRAFLKGPPQRNCDTCQDNPSQQNDRSDACSQNQSSRHEVILYDVSGQE